MSDDKDVFTCTFAMDIAKFDGNPFYAETVFGRPQTIGRGDAFAEVDRLEHELNDALERAESAEAKLALAEYDRDGGCTLDELKDELQRDAAHRAGFQSAIEAAVERVHYVSQCRYHDLSSVECIDLIRAIPYRIEKDGSPPGTDVPA